jgi:peptidoglycan/LPS O-acetylase OafA/YrhL
MRIKMAKNNYHYEIDGLRAVSVLVIILFHLDVAGFHGGFIGVDIFFVISGYLITNIIASSLSAGHFSFKDFYIRRATRILPALFATILLVLPIAMYLQQPAALVHTAQESIYALFSLSNIFFWTESGYWTPSAENYVLLHTWSLGVEEQFYLIYPLLLVLAYRLAGGRGVIILLLITTTLGTAATEMVAKIDGSAAFYLTPLRFYEFAFGGLAAMLPGTTVIQKSRSLCGAATAAGLALILFASLKFNGIFTPPGIFMLVPVLGALLVILAGPSPVANILLINPVMSWLGKISYSLYLVHWPIVVFYRYFLAPALRH